MQGNDDRHSGTQLWLLPLVAGVLPAIASLTALWLTIEAGLMSPCNPLLDGCVSISRAARHGLSNHVFRALVLPAAVLQGLTWMFCAAWLKGMETETRTQLRVLTWLGILAALFLILYGTFLGTEGMMYRFMRRQGITFYFGFTYLSMLITSGELWRLAQAGRMALPARLDLVLPGVCAVTLAVGLTQAFGPLFLDSEDLKDRLGNLMEWHAALSFTLFFFALAWLWWRTRFSIQFANRK